MANVRGRVKLAEKCVKKAFWPGKRLKLGIKGVFKRRGQLEWELWAVS